MQSTLEKGMEQTHEELRKKAGEISGMFAAELDHYSRSYVEHTQGQIEETGRATIETLGQQAADVTATSLSAIQQQAQNQTEAAPQPVPRPSWDDAEANRFAARFRCGARARQI